MALPLLLHLRVPRPALIVTVAFVTLTSGCATDRGVQAADPVNAALSLAAGVVIGGAYYWWSQPPSPDAPPPPPQPLVGQVRWQGSSEGVAAVPVTLRRAGGVVVPTTTTDRDGWFRFPFPLQPGWYTVSVNADDVAGETTLWLQDRRPAALVVLARPRPRSKQPAVAVEALGAR